MPPNTLKGGSLIFSNCYLNRICQLTIMRLQTNIITWPKYELTAMIALQTPLFIIEVWLYLLSGSPYNIIVILIKEEGFESCNS